MRIPGRLLILGCLCSVIALVGPGQAEAQTADPITPLIAVDSVGKPIGQVLRMDLALSRMQVAMEVEGNIVFVTVGKDSFSHAARPYVYDTSVRLVPLNEMWSLKWHKDFKTKSSVYLPWLEN